MTSDPTPDRTGDPRAELREIREAQAAVRTAITNLDNTAEKLRSAKEWGTFDTWFGGGLFSSWIKRDKVRDVDLRIRHLDESLAAVRKELADVGVGDVGGVGVSGLNLTLDVWFDNIVSDLMTQSRLKNAAERLNAVGVVLVRLQTELGRRERAVQDLLQR